MFKHTLGYFIERAGGEGMINFEEELEKFQPSLEIEQAEEAIYNNDLTDVTDIMRELIQEIKR